MATFNRTLNITSTAAASPSAITQNVTVGDIINCTVTMPTTITGIVETNCVADPTTSMASGTVNQIDTFSSTSYSVSFTGSTFSKPPTTYYGRISGSVSSASPTYSINAPASINEGSSGTVNVTTTNVSNGTTLYWDVDQSGDYATSQGTVSISSNAGSFTLTPTADSSTEGAETDTVRLYTDSGRTNQVASDSFTINDTSQGGGGGSGGGGDGTGTYGLIVYGPDNSTELFSSRIRQTNILVGAFGVSIGAGATQSYTGIADATDSDKIAVTIRDYSTSHFYYTESFTVTRSTANGGTVSITNDSNTTLTPDILIFRIA